MKTLSEVLKNLFFALALSLALTPSARAAGRFGLDATFLQLDNGLREMGKDAWAREFAAMKATGVDMVIIQYAKSDGVDFFAADDAAAESKGDLLGTVLGVADAAGLKVMVGIGFDTRWFSEWKWNDVQYMKDSVALNEKLIPQIWERYGKHASFAGWYIPHEIADWDYRDLSIFAPELYNLRFFYTKLVDLCKKASPRPLPVLLSAFYVGRFTPEYVEYSFREMLKGTKLDALLVQDGDGVRHWRDPRQFVVPYLRAFQNAAKANDVQLWGIVETFDMKESVQDWNKVDLKFDPAPIERILRQIAVARPFVQKQVQFEFFHYMSPERGEAQKKLYNDVLSFMRGTLRLSNER